MIACSASHGELVVQTFQFREEFSTISRKKIVKGVVDMLNVKMALEDDEKLLVVTGVATLRGTVHVAIGDNFHMGGAVRADMHEDFIIPSATLMLGNKVVMKNGKMNI
jgi:hypothetical protein